MRILLLVLFACPLTLAGSEAPFVGFGNDYLERCGPFTENYDKVPTTSAQTFQLAYCGGFTEGLKQMMMLIDGSRSVCVPRDVKTVEIERLLTRWIKEHPESAHELTVAIAAKAMLKTFPCVKK